MWNLNYVLSHRACVHCSRSTVRPRRDRCAKNVSEYSKSRGRKHKQLWLCSNKTTICNTKNDYSDTLLEPAYLIQGNFSVRVKRDPGEWFMWKTAGIEATPARIRELDRFSEERTESLLHIV